MQQGIRWVSNECRPHTFNKKEKAGTAKTAKELEIVSKRLESKESRIAEVKYFNNLSILLLNYI